MGYELWKKGRVQKPSDFFSMSYLDTEVLQIYAEIEDEEKTDILQNIFSRMKDAKDPQQIVVDILFNLLGCQS